MWNNQPISTENNLSPLQKYVQGTLENIHADHTGVESILSETSMADYGFEPNGPFPIENDDYQVSVPSINLY